MSRHTHGRTTAEIGCGTATLTDPEDIWVNVPGVRINLVLTARCDFKVRLTWVTTRRLRVASCAESVPRIAFLSLAPGPVFVSFPIRYDPPPVWGGVEMRRGDIVLHGCGDHIYQRTSGAGRWGLVSVAPKDLADFSQAVKHADLSAPPGTRILRPPSKLAADLLRSHAQACRLAETKPDTIAHREVARAIEENLLDALVNCLTDYEAHHEVASRQRCAKIMARFHKVLASSNGAPRSTQQIAVAVGVPERTLRKCCDAFLGMSPGQYARLRQLNLLRAALRQADPATASIAAIARQCGFSELGRFAVAYRTFFGEKPSATLRNLRSRPNLHSARSPSVRRLE
jgi:AraC-like DNA-binding protein